MTEKQPELLTKEEMIAILNILRDQHSRDESVERFLLELREKIATLIAVMEADDDNAN